MCAYSVSQLCHTLCNPTTIAHQAPLSMGFSWWDYWSGLLFSLPGDIPDCNPTTIAHQAPLSMGFSWWDYWSGLLFSLPGDIPDPGIEPVSLAWASLMAQRLKRLPAMQETWVRSLDWEDPLEKEMQPSPVFLPGESHGWRSLVDYSPRGRKELYMTERLN